MSIKSFIQAAELLYQNNYYNEALCLVCSAIDACAAKRYPDMKAVSSRYKEFLSQYFPIICEDGFPGIKASSIWIKVNCKVDTLKPDKNGYVDMTQIIYHTIRCGLVHNCAIDESIIFGERTVIADWQQGKFFLPRALILGLISVVKKEINEV